MKPKLFETGKMPAIEITSCAGDLVIRGWGDPNVLVVGDEAEVQETEAGITIATQGDRSTMSSMPLWQARQPSAGASSCATGALNGAAETAVISELSTDDEAASATPATANNRTRVVTTVRIYFFIC